MSLSKANLEIKTKFQDLCHELNMDKETEESAWRNYNDISQRFSLDGDPCQWICCALYAACRESFTPTVGGSDEVVKGNCVSLTKLLRSCNVSIYDFFTKIKNWCEMGNLSQNFSTQVKRLEHGFTITLSLFDWYYKIFGKVFLVPPHEKKNKKSRPMKCSATKLFDLCWCLFLCAKNQGLNFTPDFVSSFHLLLCSVDLIYGNVLAENRVELVNPNFEGVPEKWNTPAFNAAMAHTHCIIDSLCKINPGEPNVEAMSMKLNTWKKIVTEFIKTKTLLGNKETFMDIISNNNFEPNLKSLNSAYEQYVLSVGEFDERILLQNYKKLSGSDSSGGNNMHINQGVRSSAPETPFTRRPKIPTKNNESEPMASVTENVRKLQEIADIKEPSNYIKQAGENTMQKLDSKLESMKARFKEKYPMKSEADDRFKLARSLYFFLLEKIIQAELKTKLNIDSKALLENDTLNTTLITCCAEIVLNAYNTQLKFPWTLDCFDLKAFNFIKIIEIVVKRQQDILTRDLIKHLNFIEGTCLESLAWKSDSPIWDILGQRSGALPSWADVDVNKKAHCSQERNLIQSPMNSAYECFSLSASTSTSDSARRDLFNVGKASESKPVDVPKSSSVDFKGHVSISLFLRKFYTLAWMRMKELCKELEMGDEKHVKKIWTLFEHSITDTTDLMKDRHLDQLLMCATYIYIKVGEIPEKTFKDIMTAYRKQPQAVSNIYREVFIDKDGLVCDDIICFYNRIYVQKMTPYALDFSEKKKSQCDLLLSPHPIEKPNPPKKLSNHIYIHQLEKNEVQYSPNHITYEFHKSPAKDLDKMNEIVRRGKRNLTFNDEEPVVIKKLVKSNLHFQEKLLGIKHDRTESK